MIKKTKPLTQTQHILLSMLAFALAYLFFLLATDTGSLLQWGFTFISLGFGINWLVNATKHITHK